MRLRVTVARSEDRKADLRIASAAKAAVWGAFMNAGQTCLSVERCYVHRSLYPQFVEACVKKTRELHVGNGAEGATEMGPMISERQLRLVESHVEEARLQGARVLAGGQRLPDIGANFYAPTVLADVNHQMRIMTEETFGPVLPIMPFDAEDEAVQLANNSIYGLAASVWTPDRARGESLASRINAGTVMVNDLLSGFAISEAPHGGFKDSGIGRTHGLLGMDEMVRVKYLDSDYLPRMKKLWWYGYGPAFAAQMEGFIDLFFARGMGQRLSGALRSLRALRKKKSI